MDDIKNLLKNPKFNQPTEVNVIKKYVLDKFNEEVGVDVRPKTIIINAPSSALAATLRLNIQELTELCKTEKKLVIKIG